MAYKGQLPEQSNPNLPPDLRNLLAIQKIMREKKDAAQAADEKLAKLMGNPNQPTVSDALKQQAQQEIQASQEPENPDQLAEQSQPQKMGLAALAAKNQGAAQAPQAPPQAAQGMPQGAPEAAPQMMAAGGLASAKSNLPSSYQNGGIVAFDEGGPTGDAVYSPEGILVSGTETTTPTEVETETLRERMGLGNKANRTVLEGIGKPANTLNASTDAARRAVANASTVSPEESQRPQPLGPLARGYVPPVPVSAEEMRRGERDTTPVEVNASDIAINKVLSREGGKVANDAGKGMTNFGINKTANPDVDVENLTRDSAKDVYKLKYWDAIGGNALAAQNPVLAEIAFDTAVNQGQSVAKKLLAESKGDVERFNELRKNSYEQIAKNDKTKAQYLPAWLSRADSSLASAQGSFKQGVYSAPVDRVAGKTTEYPGGLATLAANQTGAAREPNATSDYVTRILAEGAPERAAEEAVAKRREAYGGLEAANLQQMQDYIAQKKASNLASQPSTRDQWAAFLSDMGGSSRRRGEEFAGVGQKVAGREAAQRAANEKSLDEINLLTMGMEQARASGKIGDYKAYEEKLKDFIGQQEKASTVGAAMSGVQEQTAERRERQRLEIAARKALLESKNEAAKTMSQAQVQAALDRATKITDGEIFNNPDYIKAMKEKNTEAQRQIRHDLIVQHFKDATELNQMMNPTTGSPSTMASAPPQAGWGIKRNP